MLAVFFALTGCSSSEKAVEMQPRPVAPPTMLIIAEEPSASPETTPTATIDCPSSLDFEGRDVNAQHYPRSYSTTDADLISAVWKIISSNEREEVADYQSWEDTMHLTFLGSTTERVNIQPDDYCELVDSGKKYSLAPGSYATISKLLTEYTSENCTFFIDENFLNIDTSISFPIEFYFDQTEYVSAVSTEIGDFTKDWVLVSTDIHDWEHTGRFAYIRDIYTKEGFGPVEVSVHFDELLITVSCDGVSKLFSTDQATMDSIDSLIESLENR